MVLGWRALALIEESEVMSVKYSKKILKLEDVARKRMSTRQ